MPVATASAETVPVAVGTTRAETMANSDSLTAPPQTGSTGAPPESPRSPLHEFSVGGHAAAVEEDKEPPREPRVKANAVVKIGLFTYSQREVAFDLVNESTTGIQFTATADFESV